MKKIHLAALLIQLPLLAVVVNSQAELNTQIENANTGALSLIEFGSSFNLNQTAKVFPLSSTSYLKATNNPSYTIDGKGFTFTNPSPLTYQNSCFFARANPNPITLANLTLVNMTAKRGRWRTRWRWGWNGSWGRSFH